MTIKTDAVKRISDSIFDDLQIQFKNMSKEYLDSKEFQKLVNEKVTEIENLLGLANLIADEVDELNFEKYAYVTLGDFTFPFNKELGLFVYNDIEDNAKKIIINELKLQFTSWSINDKERYIRDRILAIVSTLDSGISFDAAKKVVQDSINLGEILHNKDI